MDDRYCSRCGSPLATVLDSGRERLGCPTCGHVLGLLPLLVGGDPAGGGERQRRTRDLEGRLRSLLAQIDASRDEMSEGDVDSSQLREVGALRREIDELRQLEKGT